MVLWEEKVYKKIDNSRIGAWRILKNSLNWSASIEDRGKNSGRELFSIAQFLRSYVDDRSWYDSLNRDLSQRRCTRAACKAACHRRLIVKSWKASSKHYAIADCSFRGASSVCVECRRPNNVGAGVIVTCANIGPYSLTIALCTNFRDEFVFASLSARFESFKKGCGCVISPLVRLDSRVIIFVEKRKESLEQEYYANRCFLLIS